MDTRTLNIVLLVVSLLLLSQSGASLHDYTVELDDLPDRSVEGDFIEVGASANGPSLDQLRILYRLEGSIEWQEIGAVNCSGDECSGEFNYTRRSPGLTDFMAVIRSEGDVKMSDKKSVYFREREIERDRGDDPDEEDERIESVDIEDLPSRYRSDRGLDISAEAEGRDLNNLQIQKRGEDTIIWSNVREKDCGSDSTCNVSVDDFEWEQGVVTFRARASSGKVVKFSNTEIVEFYGEKPRRDGGKAFLEVNVEDQDDDSLEDARVEVENGEDRVRYTDDEGEASFWLEADDYDVEVSKDGYESEDRSVELEEDDERSIRFELNEDDHDENDDDGYRDEIRILRVEHPEEVCRGQNLRANVVIENSLNRDETVAVWGTGLSRTDSRVLDVDRDEVEETEIVFEEVAGSGMEQFTVRMENSESDSRTRSVEVRNCAGGDDGLEDSRAPTGLTASVTPRKVIVGETFRVHGDISGARRPQEVTVRAMGNIERLSSTRNGEYQVFFTPEEADTLQVRVSAAGFTRTRQVEVVPKAEIRSIEMPRKVFSGESFEACAKIESGVEAKVVLEKDGRTIKSANGNGRICFEVVAEETGVHDYRFRALTYGTGSEAVKRIEVLEQGEQFSSFPRKIATVSTEGGTFRATVYNNEKSATEYSLEVENLDDRWVSPDSRDIVLPRGGRETVYFYLSPRKTGIYSPELAIRVSGEEVFRKEIQLESMNYAAS